MAEPETCSDHEEYPVAVRQGLPYRQDPFGRPRLNPARGRGRRPDRAGPAWIASQATVLDRSLEDAGERRPDQTDRGRTKVLLQPLLPVPQDFRADGVERLSTQVGNDVAAYPLLDPLDRGRVTALGWPPVGRDVVLEGDCSIAGIDELASACIGLGLGEPGLGVLKCVEGTVLDAGDALDSVAGALAVHGGAVAFAGFRVRALLQPSVFYVAGQVELLVMRVTAAFYGAGGRVRRW